jgi:DNA invertase Pin-like site-specific DNA recombinase
LNFPNQPYPAVDRLWRDSVDLLIIVSDRQKAGSVLCSIAESIVDMISDFAERALAILGVAAKLKRRQIKERTAVGCTNAKARGVKFGRKPKFGNQ